MSKILNKASDFDISRFWSHVVGFISYNPMMPRRTRAVPVHINRISTSCSPNPPKLEGTPSDLTTTSKSGPKKFEDTTN